MNEPVIPQKANDNGRTMIIATTVILLTCIISCAAVLIVLVLRVT
jgi:hypothetical protein